MAGETAPTVKIQSGVIQGIAADGIRIFKGVPYAAPPVGELRFRAPAPAMPWEGIRMATDAGPTAPHEVPDFPALDLPPVVGTGWTRGDDYLTVNVWAPEAPVTPRPVMVWIHGGGFTLGSKDAAVYDGSSFARSGAVTVAMNYRLGIEGFIPVEGAPTNIGLRDVLAALSWVKENAAAFGGDAENITIFGESAGGIIVALLVTSPLAEGLFHRAIVQSGNGSGVRSLPVAQGIGRAVAKRLGVPATRDGLAAVDAETLVKTTTWLARPGTADYREPDGTDPSYALSRVLPVYGDDVLPLHPLDALSQGAGKDIELLLGTNAEEANFWFAPTVLRFIPAVGARIWLGRSSASGPAIYRKYRTAHPELSASQAFALTIGDLSFRWPLRRYAAAHRGRTHLYDFDWRSPAAGGRLGASHAVEMAFVFDTLEVTTGEKGFSGTNPPRELATRMHQLWYQFAVDGSLPWPEFDATKRLVYHPWADATAREAPLVASKADSA